jgi:hypothetical protein
MPAPGRSVHNVGMIARPSTPVLWAAVVLTASLALAGCGGSTPKKTTPTTDANQQTAVPVPTGVQLTAYGSELKFGQPARVAYAPNALRKSILELTVTSVTQGAIADFGGYKLDDRTRASTPYYVHVTAKNIGDGDVGRTRIPLYLVDNRTPSTLINFSTFDNSFTKCPSLPFPTTFAPQAQLSTCLVYLVPDHGTMRGVSFRDVNSDGIPILWTGSATPPAPVKKKKAS